MVPNGSIFVIGDSTAPYSSVDSRIIGTIRKENIVGKAIKIIYPFNRVHELYNKDN